MMKKIYLFSILLLSVIGSSAQEIDKAAAMKLVTANAAGIGLSTDALQNCIVSNAYHNNIAGTQMVYLQQSYKGLPIFNQLQSLAFKNGNLVSLTGQRLKGVETLSNHAGANPAVSAEQAVRAALANKKLSTTLPITAVAINGNQKVHFGKMDISSENITAELMWVPVNDAKSVKLAWQVYLVPTTSSDYWLIRVDAGNSQILEESNLTVYCKLNDKKEHHHDISCTTETSSLNNKPTAVQSTAIVNSAQYKVVPFPAESPKHPGGTPVVVSNPWNAAPNNATTLKWHSDGSADYNYTRGNNVWAYHDRVNTNTPASARSATSTTSPDPLTFNFTHDFNTSPVATAPVQNQQFNITNLFYWNNVTHDILYQYGFDEPSGNFQTSNQGRGGAGNDYVMAEAQDGGGDNNANFSTPADGGRPRMQMYLWDGPSKLDVNTPASIAGTYPSVESAFSTANKLINVGPVTAQVIYYNDDIGGTTHDACVAAVNVLTGKIALINRNVCSFVIKVKNAQLAGAVAVIVVNNVAGAPIIMGGTDNTITIPAVMISQADGAILAAQLANNLNVTLSSLAFDGDVDNGIIVHEYAHGISNRLTAGPSQVTCLQNAEQAGEGWSDYYALMLTQDWAASNVNTGFTSPRGIGTYAFAQNPNELGIRTKRYSTDFTVNDLVYTATLPGTGQQHTRGELWAAVLWDMTWNIIQQTNSITPSIYNASGTGGNIIALKLVTEGLKLQPCSPGFIDGRDAILKADQLLYGGQYSCAIREAFRRRGMGTYASQGSSQSVIDQIPDFTPFINLTLSSNVAQAPEGTNVIYTHTISTCGALTNYQIRDTLPANVTYVSGGTYDVPSRVVSFPVNFTAAGTQSFNLTVNINNGTYYTPVTYLNEQVPANAFPSTLVQTTTTANNWQVSSALFKTAPYSLLSPNATIVSDQILTTNAGITLGSNQSSFSFWHRFDTEPGYDGGVIEISTDNGTTWADLGNNINAGYYNGKMDVATGTPIAGRQAYTGTILSFIKTNVNLSTFAGQTAKLRWRFNSDDGTALTGWYVDDILVKNEAVVNLRSNLFNASGSRIIYADTVTVIESSAVCNNAAITTQPANATICAGSAASFTVVATGSLLNYQWQVSTDGGAIYSNITGATTATLNLAAVTSGMNNNRYRVIVSNTCPSSVTSTGAILTVTNPTAISTQPASVTVCAGANATFSVSATGTTITYQWQVSTDGGTSFTNITGATASSLTLTAVTTALNNNQYRVVLSSCVPGGLTSGTATLTVNSPASITSQPVNANACGGSNASFSVIAAGTAIAYQWQVSTDGGASFTNITGAIAATLNLTAVSAGMDNNRYRVIVSNACPSSVTSAAAVLSVTSPTTIGTHPVSVTVCAGANAIFSVSATGTAITYQWQVSTDGGSSFSNITGATATSLTLSAVTTTLNNNRYRVVLSSCAPGGLTSNAATLTVNSPANITTQPVNVAACTGSNVSFATVATGTAITYQWQLSTDGGTSYANITGATAATLNLTAVTAVMNNNRYRVIVSNTCPSSITSTGAILTVSNPTVISAQPAGTTVCAGANVTFNVTATGSSLSYQWQLSTNGGASWINITGANTASLTLNSVTVSLSNNQYRVVLSDCAAGSLNSNAAILIVNGSASFTTQPVNMVACTGNNVSFTSAATGTAITYQWQVSNNGGTSWANISGATSNSLLLTAVTSVMNGNQYRVVVTGTCTPAGINSNSATLTINNSVTISQQPVSTAVCAGTNAGFTTTASGSGLTYQWQVSTNGGTSWTNITGATSTALTLTAVTPAQSGNQYRAVLNGDCVSNLFTAAVTLTVNSSVAIVTQPANQVGCAPNPVTFSVTTTGTGVTYQWQVSINGGTNWTNITGATASTYTIASLSAALNGNQYRVITTGTPCGALTSSAATLTVASLPTVTLTSSPYSTLYPSLKTTLNASASPTGTYSYQWYKNNVLVPGVIINSLIVNIDELGTYKVLALNSNGCNNFSNNLLIADSSFNGLFVYPNPNRGQFQVRYFNSGSGPVNRTISVYDAKGARVYFKQYAATPGYSKMEVILTNVQGGIYSIDLRDSAGKRIASSSVVIK